MAFPPARWRDRIREAGAKLVITADGGWRRGKAVPLKDTLDEAMENSPSVARSSCSSAATMRSSGTTAAIVWWHDADDDAAQTHEAAGTSMPRHPLFMFYTSGTTGKPKGIRAHHRRLHGRALYSQPSMVFDLRDEDVYWCTADVGWITGHSYVVYGPLANGATSPDVRRRAQPPASPTASGTLVERHQVPILYTAPTAIRAFMKLGRRASQRPRSLEPAAARDRGRADKPGSLDVVSRRSSAASAARSSTPGGKPRPAAIMLSPLPGATPTKPGSCTMPLPGIVAECVDKRRQARAGQRGRLFGDPQPWPSMLRTIYGDHERFVDTYFGQIEGCYFAGDGARNDEDGYFWVMGRVDDVINVSGHRLSHHGSRKRAGVPSQSRRSRCRRPSRIRSRAKRSSRLSRR